MVLVFKTNRDADFAVLQFATNNVKFRRCDGTAIEIVADPGDGLELDLEKLGLEGISSIII